MEELKGKIKEQLTIDVAMSGMEDMSMLVDSEKMGWEYWDSNLDKFDDAFECVLPKGCPDLNTYVGMFYSDKKGDLIGMELGGPAIKLFEELAPDYFKKTAGICLTTYKDLILPPKHEVIEANVFHKIKTGDRDIDGFQRVVDFTKREGKVDILIQDMVGGSIGIDNDLFTMYLKRWYRLLSSEGTMFIVFPVMGLRDRLKNYQNIYTFLDHNRDIFDFKFETFLDSFVMTPASQILRLRKLEGAPEDIDSFIRESIDSTKSQ